MRSKEFQVIAFDGEENWQVRFKNEIGWKTAAEIRTILTNENPFPTINYSDTNIPRIPLKDPEPKQVRVAITGIPGSGKTTISRKLAQYALVPYISITELAKEEIINKSPLGREIEKYQFKNKGRSLPDDLAIALIRENQLPTYFVLDGFPLSIAQHELVVLGKTDIILLDTPSSIGYKRLIERGDEHEMVAPRIATECPQINRLAELSNPIRVGGTASVDKVVKEIRLKIKYHHDREIISV